MKKNSKFLPACFALGLLLCLVLFSAQANAAAVDALKLCAMTLVPTLFPFYSAVNLFLNAGVLPDGKGIQAIMQRCFLLPGAAASALLLGLLGGYPIGASVTAALYRQGQLTRNEAIRLSMFANNAGPGFIFGAVGLTVFHSVPIGLLLFCIHLLSALAVGVSLRMPQKSNLTVRRKMPTHPKASAQILPEAVSAALQSMLMICAYVVFSSVLLAMVKSLPPCGLLLQRLSGVLPAAEALFSGFVELSCGILALRGLPIAEAFVSASFLLGCGGVCVFLQSAAVLTSAGLPVRQCLQGKLLQGVYSAVLSCAVCCVMFRPFPSLLWCAVFFAGIVVLCKIRGRKNRYSLL